MAEKLDEPDLKRRLPYGSFADRYPDYPSWLDGDVWRLDVETEIEPHETLENFRASLYYQARVLRLGLSTKQQTREGRRVLLVQAYERPDAA